MTAGWVFRELRAGDKDRQPTVGEFFATDAIDSIAEALVRESVQNSLDAGPKASGLPVRIRFRLGVGTDALSASAAQRYFRDGWPHFTAGDNGLDEVPDEGDACPFLVVEDFGTTGLVGDTNQWRLPAGEQNPFYFFFRAEGRSGKGAEDRGRWGIGKYVFPRSSRINAFIALTVRSSDSKRLLMGQAVLKSHAVGEGYFTPDGDFGLSSESGLVLPVEDKTLIDRFITDFRLSRSDEPGLSVVVPWVDQSVTRDSLLRAVVEDYFFPILSDALVVTISTGDGELEITKDSLADACKELGENFERRMMPLIRLAAWALELSPDSVVRLEPANPSRPIWEPALVPSSKLIELRERFRAGEQLALEVPLTVREKRGPSKESLFHVYLVNDGSETNKPVFIREGITISDVRARAVPGVRSIVVAKHSPLAKLLGDSENPAHTQWQKEREHFRHKYTFGPSYIEFVTQSVSMFVRFLNESDEKPDRDLLSHLFSLPKEPESKEPKEKSKPRVRNKGDSIKPDPKVEPTKRRFTLSRVAGGFTIAAGHPEARLPAELRIAVAYDRRRGSPMGKYVPADFRINKAPIKVEVIGANVIAQGLNRLVTSIQQRDFCVTVTGFDENRDLFVGVDAREASDDSEA